MEKITDFISGINVPATPEEVNATQPISKILFEDYGYPKDKIIWQNRGNNFHMSGCNNITIQSGGETGHVLR